NLHTTSSGATVIDRSFAPKRFFLLIVLPAVVFWIGLRLLELPLFEWTRFQLRRFRWSYQIALVILIGLLAWSVLHVDAIFSGGLSQQQMKNAWNELSIPHVNWWRFALLVLALAGLVFLSSRSAW